MSAHTARGDATARELGALVSWAGALTADANARRLDFWLRKPHTHLLGNLVLLLLNARHLERVCL